MRSKPCWLRAVPLVPVALVDGAAEGCVGVAAGAGAGAGVAAVVVWCFFFAVFLCAFAAGLLGGEDESPLANASTAAPATSRAISSPRAGRNRARGRRACVCTTGAA